MSGTAPATGAGALAAVINTTTSNMTGRATEITRLAGVHRGRLSTTVVPAWPANERPVVSHPSSTAAPKAMAGSSVGPMVTLRVLPALPHLADGQDVARIDPDGRRARQLHAERSQIGRHGLKRCSARLPSCLGSGSTPAPSRAGQRTRCCLGAATEGRPRRPRGTDRRAGKKNRASGGAARRWARATSKSGEVTTPHVAVPGPGSRDRVAGVV